ncbi:hypothetical protein D9M72_303150 [compost metagenome]
MVAQVENRNDGFGHGLWVGTASGERHGGGAKSGALEGRMPSAAILAEAGAGHPHPPVMAGIHPAGCP